MIEQTIKSWHRVIRDGDINVLDELLAEDVEFYSPVVFKPQQGKAITKMYLSAAASAFRAGNKQITDNFIYKKEVLMGNYAVLEFESELEGIYINGVDIITCNEEGKIVEFKVMIRPLKALNAMHQQMKMMLSKINN